MSYLFTNISELYRKYIIDIPIKAQYIYWLCILSKSETVQFSLIEPVICLFTDSSLTKYFSLLNQLIFTDSPVKQIFLTAKPANFH